MVAEQETGALQSSGPNINGAKKAIYTFLHQYLLERNVEKAAGFIPDRFLGIGISSEKIIESRAEFVQMMQEEKSAYPQRIPFQIPAMTVRKISKVMYECAGKIEIELHGQSQKVKERVRFSCNLQWTAKTWLITMIHVSQTGVLRKGSLIPGIFFNGTENLDSHTQDDLVRMMCHMMPGGILGIKNERGFPVSIINDHMLNMLGYTYDGFIAKTQGLLVNLIYEPDRERILKKLKNGFANNKSYELEYRLKKQDGSFLWVYTIGRVTSAEGDKKAIINMVMDITHTMETRNRLRAESERDPLTKLYNRKGGESRIRKALEQGDPYIFLILDIDNFKALNDGYGHYQGDQVLCFLAKLLTENFRKSDTIYRIGGDEFGIFLGECKGCNAVRKKLIHICECFHEWGAKIYPKSRISVSLGGIFGKGNTEYVELYQMADKVLYQVKKQGKGSVLIRSCSKQGIPECISADRAKVNTKIQEEL